MIPFRRMAVAITALLVGCGPGGVGQDPAVTGLKEFYVAPGGADTNPGTSENPWATLTHAGNVLSAGERVTVRAGIYPRQTILPKHSGEPGKPIVYRGAPGERVLLDGAPGGGDRTRECFRFDGLAFEHLVIENLEIQNYGKPLVFGKGASHAHIVLAGLDIHDCERGMIVYGGGHHDWVIQDCRFHAIREAGVDISGERLRFERCQAANNDDGKGQDGDADGFHVESGRHVEFVDCLAERNSEDGFDIKASDVTMSRCRSIANGNNYKLWGQDVTLINCVAFRAQDSNLTCAANSGAVPFRKRLIHCTLAGDPPGAQGRGYGIGFSGGSHHVTLRNCLIADVGRPFYAWKKNARVSIDEDYNVFHTTSQDFMVQNEGPRVSAAEFATAWRTRFGGGVHSILAPSIEDVAFVDLSGGDLRLRRGSRCDIGFSEFAQKDDVTQAPRRQGVQDCGAYERVARP